MRRFSFLQTVSARLTLLNVFLLALVLLFLGVILRAAVSVNLIASIDRNLARRARHHQHFWATAPQASHAHWFPPGQPGRSWPSPGSKAGTQTSTNRVRPAAVASSTQEPTTFSRWRTPVIERVFDLKGKQSWPPVNPEAPWDSVSFAQAANGGEKLTTIFDGTERVRVLSAPLRRQSGVVAGVVQVGASLSAVDSSLANLNGTLLTLAPVALLVSGLGGLVLMVWMHRPLRQVNQAIALIGAEDLSRRLVVRGRDEFSMLAANFNAMLSRLEKAFEQQRRFAADASHELRTPLTVIKVYSSRGLADPESTEKQRQAWAATDRAATMMNAIVQDLLLLARSDAGQLLPQLQPTSLWATMEAAIEAVQDEGGASILNAIPKHLMANGDGILLTRVFTNLLNNARRHTPTEGVISIRAELKGERLVVEIADTGTGIPPLLCVARAGASELREGGTANAAAACEISQQSVTCSR